MLKTFHKKYGNNAEAWYLTDEFGKMRFHREDGPAFIHDNIEEWWYEGELHRIDGPAYIYNNNIEYWIHDHDITNEVELWIKENNITYPFDDETKLLFKLRFL